MKTLSLFCDSSQLVDRDSETKEILKDISDSNRSKIAIIAAPTAVGKSSLVQKIWGELVSNRLKVCVKSLPENIGSNPNEWVYFNNIFNSLNTACAKSGLNEYTFEHFIVHCKSKVVRKEVWTHLVNSLCKEQSKASVVGIILSLFLKRIFRLDYYNADVFENNNSTQTIRIKSQYVDYVLGRINVIFNIDNIQNIDAYSLNQLTKWISSNATKKHYYLFEYTLSKKNTFLELQKLQNYLTDCGVHSVTYQLEKMSPDYIVDIVSKHTNAPIENMKFNVELLEFYKNDESGNIRKAIDFSINYTDDISEKNTAIDNPSLVSLKNLSDEAKYIVSLLICNNSNLSFVDIIEVAEMQYISHKKLMDVISELKDKQIIIDLGDSVEIKHASLTDAWDNAACFGEYNQLAYKNCEQYYLDIIKNNKQETSQKWIQLLHLYAKYNPRKIETLLDYIKSNMIGQISPHNAWHYMKMLIDETKATVIDHIDLYYSIIKICFECELYIEGYECIVLLENEIPLSKDYKLLLYKGMFLSALDRHEENVKLCEKYMCRNLPKNIYFNLCLIVMASYRSLNLRNKCMDLYYELSSDKEYRQYLEYGYFLRLTCMYLPIKPRIKNIQKSIRFFKKRKEYHQAGKSLISYAYALASAGKFRKAYQSIIKAQYLLQNKQMGQHMFLVNKASILICKGIYSKEVWNLLEKAEISAVVPFDRLAIIINKVILCIENKDYSAINYLFTQAHNLVKEEPDKHIHALIYYNQHVYYKQIGDYEKATEYYQKAYELRDWCPSMQKQMDSFGSFKEPNWYNCFLEYWTYDLLL